MSRGRARCMGCVGALFEESFSHQEEAAMNQLASRHRVLASSCENGLPDTRNDAGHRACAMFLESLAVAASTLHVDKASRAYRSGFTRNYKSLFSEEARCYRVDIFEACLDRQEVIYVNGEKYEFSRDVLSWADALQRSWHSLAALLERWWSCLSQSRSQTARATQPRISDVRSELESLDISWARFEERYIGELISIENRARGLVLEAVGHDRQLRHLEATATEETRQAAMNKLQSKSEYREEQCLMVASMGQLNAVANVRRKGRDDLQHEILAESLSALYPEDGRDVDLQAAMVLAADVVDSYDAVRLYLQRVSTNLERVDPHLSNNTELVSRLVDWEESWEVGAKYVQQPQLRHALCDVVAQLRALQRSSQTFQDLCESCDVELFLILPRMIWLCFLQSPKERAELLRSLLPDRFGGLAATGAVFDTEIVELIDCFNKVRGCLESSSAGEGRAMDCLANRAVTGMSQNALSEFDYLPAAKKQEAAAATDSFMKQLERWSMELQRHCPEDWNQCTSILLQCLEGTSKSQRSG